MERPARYLCNSDLDLKILADSRHDGIAQDWLQSADEFSVHKLRFAYVVWSDAPQEMVQGYKCIIRSFLRNEMST